MYIAIDDKNQIISHSLRKLKKDVKTLMDDYWEEYPDYQIVKVTKLELSRGVVDVSEVQTDPTLKEDKEYVMSTLKSLFSELDRSSNPVKDMKKALVLTATHPDFVTDDLSQSLIGTLSLYLSNLLDDYIETEDWSRVLDVFID